MGWKGDLFNLYNLNYLMDFTISGYSTALFATWYFIDELDLLFDAGDGVVAGLTQKSGKIKHIFISHADRDHLTGLLQLVQLNARDGFPKIYYPASSSSFPALQAFSAAFDQHKFPIPWIPVGPNDRIQIGKDLYVRPIENEHVRHRSDQIKSLSYIVEKTKQKLRPAFADLTGTEIGALRKTHGDEYVMETVTEKILAYSGDTPIAHDGRWDNVEILIHESTLLRSTDVADFESRGNRHSTLEEVMEMVSITKPKALILGHFSARYNADEIDRTIADLGNHYQLNFPIYRLLPGEVYRDVLNSPPIYAGNNLK